MPTSDRLKQSKKRKSKKDKNIHELYNHYATLSTRFRRSPIFLPRNLSYRRRFRERSKARRTSISFSSRIIALFFLRTVLANLPRASPCCDWERDTLKILLPIDIRSASVPIGSIKILFLREATSAIE